jgi:hypothetical protein
MLNKASLVVRETSESGNERRFTGVEKAAWEKVRP